MLFHAGILAQIEPNDYPDKRLEAVYSLHMTYIHSVISGLGLCIHCNIYCITKGL